MGKLPNPDGGMESKEPLLIGKLPNPDGGMESKEPLLMGKLPKPDGGMESKDPLGAATVRAKKAEIRAKVLIF